MADFVRSSRPVTLRARRDTIVLVAAAAAITGALASGIHAHQTGTGIPSLGWTGELSDVQPESVPASKPAITSASLVVAPAELALPKVAATAAHPRSKICDGASCPTKAAGSLAGPRRPSSAASGVASRPSMSAEAVEFVPRPPADVGAKHPSLMARLNPLRHLPDVSTVRRPLTAANETIFGWFKGF